MTQQKTSLENLQASCLGYWSSTVIWPQWFFSVEKESHKKIKVIRLMLQTPGYNQLRLVPLSMFIPWFTGFCWRPRWCSLDFNHQQFFWFPFRGFWGAPRNLVGFGIWVDRREPSEIIEGGPLLGCPRKLGSKVRISGWNTPVNPICYL